MNGGGAGYRSLAAEAPRRWRLLLAEDEPLQRRLFHHTLSCAGYDVEAVQCGEDALERVTKGHFDILITDWDMPGLDGASLCRKVRALDLNKHLHILMLTGHLLGSDLAAAIEAGADDYLRKPADRAELLARVKSGCRIVALTLELAAANARLHEMSIIDPLVRTYNRGYLEEQLPKAIETARRYGHSLSVVMADIDCFKKINDQWGHFVGDEVLKCFSDRLRLCIRSSSDWIARYGGEEFVFVLPETELQGAAAVAEKLRAACAGECMQTSRGALLVTASFGVAALPDSVEPAVDAATLLRGADSAMYRAKQEGRNRVAVSAERTDKPQSCSPPP